MANIIDYLEWRGDIPFSVDGFNEVDNLILSELSYTDFGDIVPGPEEKKKISVREVCDRFFAIHSEEEIMAKKSTTKVAPFLLPYLAESRRFGKMQLLGYVNEVDKETQSQFSVVTFALEDGTNFVAFRGTDSTIVGWKEDFNMSFLYQTHGQMQAAAYLDRCFKRSRKKLRIGGHSKGGNFAVYAASFCHPTVQNKIIEVYSNDGPGFSDNVTESEGYKRILPKVISTIPEYSIVGMLLKNELNHRVVVSSQTGAMQHDLMSWEVMGNHMVYATGLSNSSIMLDQTLKRWIYGLEPEKREEFVNILFDTLQSTGAQTIDDLKNNKLEVINEITKALSNLPADRQQAVKEVLIRFVFSGGETLAGNAGDLWSKTERFLKRHKIKLKE